MNMKQHSILFLAAIIGCTVAGCRDVATKGDVDKTLVEHAADTAAHHAKTTDAAEITTGTLDTARLDSAFTGSITTNTTDIAANTTAIATNATDVGTNAGEIATNTTDIGTNAGNIGTNATNIATNTGDVGTNATNISNNASDILTAQNDIAVLQTGFVSAMAIVGVPTDSTTGTVQDVLGGIVGRRCLAFDSLLVPLQIPDGATVTRLDYTVYENDVNVFSNARLIRSDNVVMAITASTADNASAQVVSDTTIVAGTQVIDNTAFAYYASLRCPNSPDLMPGSVRVDFTLP